MTVKENKTKLSLVELAAGERDLLEGRDRSLPFSTRPVFDGECSASYGSRVNLSVELHHHIRQASQPR